VQPGIVVVVEVEVEVVEVLVEVLVVVVEDVVVELEVVPTALTSATEVPHTDESEAGEPPPVAYSVATHAVPVDQSQPAPL
jgi:hypothetical protein